MLDPKLLRESPDLVRAAIAKKHLEVEVLDAVAHSTTAWRHVLVEVEQLRGRQKAANNEMAALPKGSPEFIAKVQEMKRFRRVKAKRATQGDLEEKWRRRCTTLPNLPHASCRKGARRRRTWCMRPR
jgi:seryl-tRNA synthetase